jgi:hypothetical protein
MECSEDGPCDCSLDARSPCRCSSLAATSLALGAWLLPGSSGSGEVCRVLEVSLLNASLFIVLYLRADLPSALPQILSRAGPLPAFHPAEGARIEQGTIYMAPPNYHLLIEEDHLHLGTGPKEQRA